MTKQKKVELFENKEKETQLRERFEKDWYNWEEVKEKLEKIRQKEEIDKNLSKLEWSVEENYKYIKSLLEKYKDELDSQESLKDKTKKSLDEKIEEEKDKLKEKLLQKTKDIPIIWWLLYNALKWIDESKEEKKDDWFWEKTKKWFFWWLWWTILTIFWWFIAYDKYKEEVENVAWKLWDGIKKWVDDASEKLKGNGVDHEENQKLTWWKNVLSEVKQEFIKELPESTFMAWFNILKFFTIEKFDINSDIKSVILSLWIKKFKDLWLEFESFYDSNNKKITDKTKYNKFVKDNWLNKYKEDEIIGILNIFFWEKTTEITMKERLSKEKLKNIFENNSKQDLQKFFWSTQEYEKVYNILQDNNYNFVYLDLKSTMILLSLSYKNFIIWSAMQWLDNVKDYVKDLLAWEWENILNKIKENIENRKDNLLPVNVISVIKWNSALGNFWWKQRLNISEKDLLEQAKKENLDEDSINKLKLFIEFRDSLLESLSNDPRYTLWITWFENEINEKMNLKDVIFLYLALDWNVEFFRSVNISPYNKWIMYYFIFKVLGKGSKDVQAWYWAELLRKNNDKDFFSDEDRQFINIMLYKLTSEEFLPLQRKIQQIEWFSRQWIEGILIDNWVPKEYAWDFAMLLEVLIWLSSFLVFKKLKFFRWIFYPAISYIWVALAAWWVNVALEQKIWSENYQSFSEWFNLFLKKSPYEWEITTKDWTKVAWKFRSLDDFERAYNDPTNFEKEQQKITYLKITSVWIENSKEEEYIWDKNSPNIFIKYDGKKDYYILYKWYEYKFWYKKYPWSPLVDFAFDITYDPRWNINFEEVNFTDNGIEIWYWENTFFIEYSELYTLIDESWSEDFYVLHTWWQNFWINDIYLQKTN